MGFARGTGGNKNHLLPSDIDGLYLSCDDSNEGYLPRGQCEMLMAGAAYAVSEAVYAFPEGSTKREWGDWVERMSSIVVRYG